MKAMLLAAGRGERLRPLTDTLPKPLIEVAGRSLIEHHLLALARAGIEDVLINLGWLGEQLPARLESGQQFGLRIAYSPEPPGALETAGGIVHALHWLGQQPFLLISADVLTDYPFADLLSCRPEGLAHLVMVDNPAHHPDGDFALVDGQLGREGSRLTYSGVGVFQPDWFSRLEPGKRALRPELERAIDRKGLSGEHYAGRWMDIGTPERLAQARRCYSDAD